MNQKRTPFVSPFDKLPLPTQVSEIGYNRLLELAKCAYMAINRAYPAEQRKANPKVEYRYAEAHTQVKQHLNFYKVNIRDRIVPFAEFIRHSIPYHDSQDGRVLDQSTHDFRVLCEQQFRMLYERLVDYASLVLPEADCPSFLEALDKVYARELKLLLEGAPGIGLAHYEAKNRYTEDDYTQ
jgi:hypothetical protein